jgi:hypothetical protein
MNETPVFHRQGFEAIKARLASPKPGVTVVVGPAGSGRTRLLQQLAVAGKELGYRVLLGTDIQPVALGPSTTLTDVRRRLQSLVDTRSEGGTQSVAASVTPEATLEEHRQIPVLLGQMAPVLVAVDGFRPSPTLELWLTSELSPWLRASEDRVAFVIADREEALRSFTASADLLVTLGPLDPDEVRTHLIKASAGFSPALTSEELDRYVRAAASEPAVLSALLVVFGAYCRARIEVPT